jgi:hypothetical protein
MTMGMVVRDVAGVGTQITSSVDSAYTSADSGRSRSRFRSDRDHRSAVNPISIPD